MRRLAAALARAADQARLLAPVARRRAAKDAAGGGIVVVAAAYGTPGALDAVRLREEEEVEAQGEDTDASPPPVLDVTAALRLLVSGGRLVLPPAPTRSGLLGFCDPAPGEPKALDVTYVHRGVPVRVRLADGAGVDLPAASPRVLEGSAADAARAAAEALAPGAGASPEEK